MLCKRCSSELSGNQSSYCSKRCGKLHLKSLYRKRRRDHVNAYKRWYRSLGKRPISGARKSRVIDTLGGICKKCGTTDNINVHHIVPLRLGGTNDITNLELFCFDCHQQHHIELKARH